MIATASPTAHQDSVLRAAAVAALKASSYRRQLDHIRCEVHDGVVSLRGELPSYYLKQMAQSAILGHVAVEGLNNLVEVRPRHRDLPW